MNMTNLFGSNGMAFLNETELQEVNGGNPFAIAFAVGFVAIVAWSVYKDYRDDKTLDQKIQNSVTKAVYNAGYRP